MGSVTACLEELQATLKKYACEITTMTLASTHIGIDYEEIVLGNWIDGYDYGGRIQMKAPLDPDFSSTIAE